jgi:dihydrofolate reductase
MAGGTTFHFVTGGIHEALDRARHVAGGREVRLGGGVATVRQGLRAGLVVELHLAIAPILLGAGEAMFAELDLPGLSYERAQFVATPKATHIVLTRR